MASRLNSQSVVPSDEYSTLLYFRKILKSWFWRYFDHFFYLLFYNFCWVSSCLGIGWLSTFFDVRLMSKKIEFLYFFLIYIIETITSLGWAYLVFKLFIVSEGNLKDVLFGIKKYFLKAISISTISGLVIAMALFNIRFYFFLNNPHYFIDFLLIGFTFWVLLFWLLGALYHWPVLFFQNPPLFNIFYKSFLLSIDKWPISILMLMTCFTFILLFSIIWPLWFFVGGVVLFSLQCVVLEKHLVMYKITYKNKPLEPFLEILDYEQQRGWREFFKPWENQ